MRAQSLGVFIMAALGGAVHAAGAQTIERRNGEAGAPILSLITAPRAAALGGALTAAEGISSVFANPAGATTVPRYGAHLAGQTLFDGARAGELAAGIRRNMFAGAIAVRYADLGTVDEVVCDGCGGRGTTTGRTLAATEQALSGVAAFALREFGSVGIAATHYSASVADASGGAFSVSVGARARPTPLLSVGASAQYLGGDATLAGFGAPLPRTVRAGIELHPLASRPGRLHVAIAADYVAARGAPGRFGGGAEVGIADPAARLSAVARTGFASGAGTAFATDALTFGGGLRFQGFALDYAFQASAAFGALHRVGIGMER